MQLAKGTRDFSPEEKIPRQELVDKLRTIFELYGFVPLETPLLERIETLAAKSGAGEDSDAAKEIFRLKDQGDRDLGLRFDLTVPMSRFVATNQDLRMPFKRYQIGRVFRDGPIKTGRYREFWQCDVDVVGSKEMIADGECVTIAKKAFEKLEIDVNIFVNNRKIITGVLEKVGINNEQAETVIISVDKLAKVGYDGVVKELLSKGIDEGQARALLDMLNVQGSNEDKLNALEGSIPGNEGLKELRELLEYAPYENVIFNPSLARGLSYYTGTVIEVFSKDESLNFSLLGGGRYDNMIGDFANNGKEYPAVGISFGLEPILETLRIQNKIEFKKTNAKVFVIPIKTMKESLEIANRLRDSNIKTDVDILDRGIGKNLNYVNAAKIPFAIIIGNSELEENKVTLKNMETGEEKKLAVEEVINELQ